MNSKTMKQRILVVDDAVENITALVALLKDDYMVTAAKNGHKALQMALKNPPDLILLDIMMPEMEGYEVCRQLKKNDATKNIPVIFITGLSEAMDEVKAFNTGAADYITKPFNPIVVKARVSTHLLLKQKSDALEALASLDGLTNIYNRRKFDETLEYECKRAARSHSPLALILMDIDYFKLFNDHYGHAQGDECLKKVASTLQNVVQRQDDFMGRYGGEEFVSILPSTDFKGVQRVAEELRQSIANLNIPHEYSKTAPYVSLSIGVAFIISQDASTSPTILIETADAMLYKSKENGRNQVNCIEL